MILLDTNLLARLTNSADPQGYAARRAVVELAANGRRLIIVPQNLYEFWTVATRLVGPPPSGQNGLGMSTDRASRWLDFFQRRFSLLPDRPELPQIWHALVRQHGVRGFRAHDARFVAAMHTYAISTVLTFNVADFARFGVEVLTPANA